ncbi:MAG: ATP-binding protein [Elusimicrobia bacterium]|nr:ATP-binding protein [Elusimicrobiota bacterium]
MLKPKRIVFTGGPSGGKTSLIEVVLRHFGDKVAAVPEAASILYSGGFPRKTGSLSMKHIQRAIYYVVRELEDLSFATEPKKIALCDRGTLDGMAYWPKGGKGFLDSIGSTFQEELARYDIVIHLSPPIKQDIYRLSTTRIENHSKALELDKRTQEVWKYHPKRFLISDEPDFLIKVNKAIKILEREIGRIDNKKQYSVAAKLALPMREQKQNNGGMEA